LIDICSSDSSYDYGWYCIVVVEFGALVPMYVVLLRYPLRQRDDDLSSVGPCVYPSSLARPYTCIRGFDIGCVVKPTRLILMTGQR
jgi:hypothetical protein